MVNANIISERYATAAMNEIFSRRGSVLAERDLWIAVMKAQRELGMDIPAEAIEKFEAAKNSVDLNRIDEIEKKTKHDVKARIQHFVEVAGAPEVIHLGMTSRDLTDNVEQMQVRQASELVFNKYVAVLNRMLERADQYAAVILTARTHHQAAQPTTVGRRFSMWGEELLFHLEQFEHFRENYPLRGIKGPVGTQFDMLTLLGDAGKVSSLESKVSHLLGFSTVLSAPGQVYPRSLDYALISHLAELSAGPANFAKTLRLMAGYELATEGFKEGQVGSTAMPHKMNTPRSERINGFHSILKMHAVGAGYLAGDQWEEGDVSDSMIRRVVLPDAFYASDGLCETTLTLLQNFGLYEVMIGREADRYLQFLGTTEMLMTAVQHGIGREEGHAIIKEASVAEGLALRRGETPDVVARLASHPRFKEAGISEASLRERLAERDHFVGNARAQIVAVHDRAMPLLEAYSAGASYQPGSVR